MDYYLSVKDLENEIECLKRNFDIVRIVNPVEHKVYKIENNNIKAINSDCYSIWKLDNRCENCASSRAFIEKTTKVKFEFINDEIYYVQSRYIEVKIQKYILEIVKKLPKDLSFGANGKGDFVEKITKYNENFYRDALTKTYNRRYFEDNIIQDMIITSSKKEEFLIGMIEIGNLKTINDIFGHTVGNQIIKDAVKVIKNKISQKQENYVIRYSGENFLLVLHGNDYSYYESLLIEIRQSIMTLNETYHNLITISYGLANLDGEVDNKSSEKLVYRANDDMLSRRKKFE